jgi:hypothetical protein
MNINLIYEKNPFNFDLREDISVKYLQDLSSKLISKDKSTFTLLYKNKDLSKNPDFLLKDLVNTEETNIPIEISLKNKPKDKKILPKISLFKDINKDINKDIKVHSTEKYHKSNKLLSKMQIYNISNKENSIKDLNENSKQNYSSDKYRDYRNEKIVKNEVFEAIYNSKETEILSLMQNLSQIIKEYDAILYKKRNIDKINKEILIFEKDVLEFKNNQITFLQKLINYFDKKESNYLRGNIDLNDFYLDLKFNIFKNDTRMKIKEKEFCPTSLKSRNKDQYNYNSSSLPALVKNYEVKPKRKIFLSKEKLENIIESNKTLKEKKEIENPLLKSERKKDQEKIENKSFGLSKIQENMKNKNYLEKKMIDKDESEKSQNESELSTSSKPQNIFHTIKSTNKVNTINNDSSGINTIMINKNNNSDVNNDEDIDDINLIKRDSSLTKYNKINTLFEISESKNNRSKDDSKQSDENSLENNKKEDDNFEVNKTNKRKSINGFVKNNTLGFMIRDRFRKSTKRAKKLGINANDFLI